MLLSLTIVLASGDGYVEGRGSIPGRFVSFNTYKEEIYLQYKLIGRKNQVKHMQFLSIGQVSIIPSFQLTY